jgi:hypothetical protein
MSNLFSENNSTSTMTMLEIYKKLMESSKKEISTKIIKILENQIEDQNLLSFSFQKTRFSEIETSILMELISINCSLTSIDFSFSFIGNFGISLFSKIVPHLKQLKIINLKSTKMDSKLAENLIDQLSNINELREINLSYLILDDRCFQSLSNLISKCFKLNSLILEGINLTINQFKIISNGFYSNQSLKKLNLKQNNLFNEISDENSISIIFELVSKKKIASLNLQKNNSKNFNSILIPILIQKSFQKYSFQFLGNLNLSKNSLKSAESTNQTLLLIISNLQFYQMIFFQVYFQVHQNLKVLIWN